MSTNWTSKFGRGLSRRFTRRTPAGCIDHIDRDAERMAREWDLIRMRFPDHA